MKQRQIRRENFTDGFRKSWWIMILPAVFFISAVAVSMIGTGSGRGEKSFLKTDADAVIHLSEPVSQQSSSGGGIEIALSEPVEEEYFNDALFVGDSITSGFTIYDMFEGFNAIYKVGVNPMSATKISFTTTSSGKELSMSEAVKYYNPRKLYIMLGTNGINWASSDELLSGYRELIKLLKSENPDCMIIVQSIPPVAKWVAQQKPSFSKENFDIYNAGLREMCIEMGIYFLDINAAFTTEDGYLSSDYSAPDGVHFGYGGYQKWYDYLMCHTVQGSSVYCIDSQNGYLIHN